MPGPEVLQHILFNMPRSGRETDVLTVEIDANHSPHAAHGRRRDRFPVICGAMYPCSNPELVAAATDAGAIGIVQPVS